MLITGKPAPNDTPTTRTVNSDPVAIARVVNARQTAAEAVRSYRASQRPASPTDALERSVERLEAEVAALWTFLFKLEDAS